MMKQMKSMKMLNWMDELCNAINQFTMNEKEESVGLPVSTGQHVCFSYNSDDEMEAEVVDAESCCKCKFLDLQGDCLLFLKD